MNQLQFTKILKIYINSVRIFSILAILYSILFFTIIQATPPFSDGTFGFILFLFMLHMVLIGVTLLLIVLKKITVPATSFSLMVLNQFLLLLALIFFFATALNNY